MPSLALAMCSCRSCCCCFQCSQPRHTFFMHNGKHTTKSQRHRKGPAGPRSEVETTKSHILYRKLQTFSKHRGPKKKRHKTCHGVCLPLHSPGHICALHVASSRAAHFDANKLIAPMNLCAVQWPHFAIDRITIGKAYTRSASSYAV